MQPHLYLCHTHLCHVTHADDGVREVGRVVEVVGGRYEP